MKTDRVRVARVLAQGLREVAEEVDASSIHVLFCRRSSNFRDPLADNPFCEQLPSQAPLTDGRDC